MTSSVADAGLPVTLYHYSYSPFARRLVWYLALRGIAYSQCIQPPIMPRPDIARLGINYRRIPVLAIGRDVYLDTRLIIRKLEQLYPSLPKLGAQDAEEKALERLLEAFMIDAGTFRQGGRLLPPSLPLMKDPDFVKDRLDYWGEDPTAGGAARARAEALVEVKNAMQLLETTLLADGREWILKTKKPSLADIEAVWPLHWLTGIPGALAQDQASAADFPKVYAWVARFQKAISAAKSRQAKPHTLTGEAAQDHILQSPFSEEEQAVKANDPLVLSDGLQKGQEVQIWPTDTGSSHKDEGKLISIDETEVVIEISTATSNGVASTIRLHAPRHGFRIRAAARL